MHSLNQIYRTIWSEALNAWVAVSELVKSKGKRSGSSLLRTLNITGVSDETDDIHHHRFKLALLAASCLLTFQVHANPMGGNVINGSASFNTSGNTLTVTNTPGAIIHWQDFSIQRNEITRFAQQSASSAVLNRVVGGNTSQILGALQSNGRVFLVNPNGVVFGAGSTVDVAGLVATSLNLSDADFLAGRHRFTSDPNAQAVSNAGNLTARQGGEIWLIAPDVENTGVITAPNGEILLAAGSSVELVNSLDPALRVNITAPAGDATNVGQLVASAGRLGLFGTVVRNSGTASADSATMQGGKIVFKSSQRTEISGTASAQGVGGGEIKVLSDMQSGTVSVSGTLDASTPDKGDGGFVDTSAAHVQVADGARISTLATNGNNGSWLIDPTDFYVSATDPANGSSWMSNTTLGTNLGSGNVTIQTLASGAGNGDIFINDAVNWNLSSVLTLNAHRNVEINASVTSGSFGQNPGHLTVRADLNGAGTGTVIFGVSGYVSLQGGGASVVYGSTNIFYNPVSYATPTDYSAYVNPSAPLTASMLVNDANQLQAINTNLAGTYALGRNIDVSAIPNFTPLGNVSTNFTGQFDGLDHTISNLSVTSAQAGVGLFGEIATGGTVKDVGLVNVSIHGTATTSAVGGLAGVNRGTISNSYVDGGTVIANNGAAGGLVGRNLGGAGSAATGATPGTTGSSAQIDNSYVANVAVSVMASGAKAAGGLVGINQGGIGGAGGNAGISIPGASGGTGGSAVVSNCYVVGGTVSGMGTSPNTGGLVGLNQGGDGGNGGNDSGSTAAGGVGGTGGLANVNNSYASSGAVSGTVGSAGGLIGSNFSGLLGSSGTGLLGGGAEGIAGLGSAITVAWDSVTTGQAVAIGGGNQDTVINISATPYSQASYTGFDFTNTWWISESNTRPFLRTEWSTYVTNPHQLQLMAMDLTASYTLGANIDAAQTATGAGMWGSAGFVPLGSFSGSLDGQGYTVSNLFINRPATASVGLFNWLNIGSSVSNLNLVGGSVTGWYRVGGLAGYSDGSISNSSVTGMTVAEAGASTLGGLVGQNGFYGSIVNSYVDSGSVTGSGQWIGGLAGLNDGSIDGSHVANSTVNGGAFGSKVGGLVGWNSSNASITNSYASNGSVSGQTSVGGLVGWNSGSIGNSYSNGGTVTGSNLVGGLVGYNSNTIDGSHAAGVAVSGNSNIGGFAGAAYGSISNSYADGGSVTGFTRFGGFAGTMNSNAISNSHYNISTMTINGSTGTMVTPYGLYNDVLNTGAVGQFSDWLADGTLNITDYSNVLPGSVGNHSIGSLDGMKALLGFSEDPTLNFTLTSAIDLLPLPGYYVPVLGANFDGGSFTISNLNINQSASNDLGLFGHVLTGNTVSNVVLQNATVNGGNRVGALAGWNEGDILNSSSTNGMIAGNSVVGGLIGLNENPYLSGGNISNSFVSGGTVQGAFTNVGGLVGHSIGGTIDTSYVTGGDVSGSGSIGGLVGSDGGEGAFIVVGNSDVANTIVSGVSDAGGLVGWLNGNISGSNVTGGSVSGGTNIGGLVGHSSGIVDSSFVVSSFVSGTASYSSAAVGGLVGFNDAGSISNSFVDGGTVQGFGQIGGLVGLNQGGMGGWGNITYPGSPGAAALISNSYVTSGTITGDGNIGGLVGANMQGPVGGGTYGGVGGDALISNSFVSGGSVNGSCTDCGGGAGGLAGYNSGIIQSSFVSNGSVAGAHYNGGLVGHKFGSISDTYVNGGSVVGGTAPSSWIYVGGLAGWNTGTIGTSYTSIGTLSGGGDMGAVVGNNDMGGSVTGTFWDNATLGTGVTGIGFDYNTFGSTDVGAAPLDAVGMKTMSNFTNAGWNIANTGGAGMIWRIYDDYTGQGYTTPLLTSFLKPLVITADPVSKSYDGATYSGGLVNPAYTDGVNPVAPNPSDILGTANAYGLNAINTGTYAPALYSGQLGYDISFVGGMLTVTPAGLNLLSVTADNASKIFGNTLTFTGTEFTPVGLVGSDTISGVTLTSAGAAATANVGAYPITPSNAVFSIGSASNYNITYVNGVLTVTPRAISISASAASKVYGSADPNLFTVGGLGLASFDTKSSAFTGSLNHTGGENVGTGYAITQGTLAANGNYSISGFTGNTLTITPATLTVIADTINKVLGTPDPALTYTVSGLQFSDTPSATVSVSLARDAGEFIGLYAINGSATLLSSNYTLASFVPGTFTILPPTVVQEITETSLSTGTPEGDDDDEKKKEVLAAIEGEDDQGGELLDNLPVCR